MIRKSEGRSTGKGSWPLPAVSFLIIARQYDALTGKSRSKAARATAADRKARGIVPGFQKHRRVQKP